MAPSNVSIMAKNFKFRYNGRTRRADFPESPSWTELAGKLQEMYKISPDQLGVSYVDDDNDEITIESNDELHIFYKSTKNPCQTLNVLNMLVAESSASVAEPGSSYLLSPFFMTFLIYIRFRGV